MLFVARGETYSDDLTELSLGGTLKVGSSFHFSVPLLGAFCGVDARKGGAFTRLKFYLPRKAFISSRRNFGPNQFFLLIGFHTKPLNIFYFILIFAELLLLLLHEAIFPIGEVGGVHHRYGKEVKYTECHGRTAERACGPGPLPPSSRLGDALAGKEFSGGRLGSPGHRLLSGPR